ncbi:hypothetical protein [Alcanivorax sediminis]|uniref:Uncharacterized protein n=1 Tax=Alcanivorax sediminis TaxID=2663008 RepID=A0A6N7LSR3_9GAMM|nr:hypothetical protein [Alcanivorax sediminis]MQX53469.1 hypothetical protein [Alcanivorax sediminis]
MKILVIIISIALFGMLLFKILNGSQRKFDLKISVKSLYPQNGSTLETGEPIFLDIAYQYSNPKENFHIWAKVLDETYSSTYQGSVDQLTPGSGEVERFVFLTEPGKIKRIHIVVKGMDFEEVYNDFIDVNYTFEESEEYKAFKSDGVGSHISSVTFDKPQGEVLRSGDTVTATLQHHINTEEGLDIWVMPETSCNHTFEGTTGVQKGDGHIQKYFTISEPCEIKELKILMKNKVGNKVYDKKIDVDFKFK